MCFTCNTPPVECNMPQHNPSFSRATPVVVPSIFCGTIFLPSGGNINTRSCLACGVQFASAHPVFCFQQSRGAQSHCFCPTSPDYKVHFLFIFIVVCQRIGRLIGIEQKQKTHKTHEHPLFLITTVFLLLESRFVLPCTTPFNFPIPDIENQSHNFSILSGFVIENEPNYGSS